MAPRPWWRRIYVHPLFFLLLAGYGLLGNLDRALVAFLVIVLHELSHAALAEAYGLSVERMEIWPFGGIARISGLSSQEGEVEAMVAVAGPLQNFLLAALASVGAPFFPVPASLTNAFIAWNLGLGCLNLLPVAPLDGGRLARIYLTRRWGRARAEAFVREGGLWLARGLFAVALGAAAFGRPPVALAVFALFLYWGARKIEPLASYLRVRDLALRSLWFQRRPIWPLDDLAVRETTPLGRVLAIMRPMHYHRVTVLDPELRPLGVLEERDLSRALERLGPDVAVGHLLSSR